MLFRMITTDSGYGSRSSLDCRYRRRLGFLSQTADMVASGGSDSSAQVLRNSRPEFRPLDASTYGFITEMLTTRASGVGERFAGAHPSHFVGPFLSQGRGRPCLSTALVVRALCETFITNGRHGDVRRLGLVRSGTA